jgi:hypothetical protein
MSTLEQDLADVMASFAEGAPDDLGLLSRVQAGSRRRTRDRRIGAAVGIGALAAAVAVVAVGPVSVPHAQNRYADPTGFLVDSRDLELRFPLAPGFLPDGLDPDPQLEETGHYGTASYQFGGRSGLQLRISHYDTAPPVRGAAATVDGKPAALSCSEIACSLAWQRREGLYVVVSVTAPGGDPTRLAQQVAEGLTDTPIVHRPRLVLGLTPAKGCLLNDPVGLRTLLNPVDLPEDAATCPVDVSVLTKQEAAQGGYADGVGEPVHVGGYPGWLQELDPGVNETHGDPAVVQRFAHQWLAVLQLRDGRRLVVLTPRTGGWDRDELDRFVRAIVVPAT